MDEQQEHAQQSGGAPVSFGVTIDDIATEAGKLGALTSVPNLTSTSTDPGNSVSAANQQAGQWPQQGSYWQYYSSSENPNANAQLIQPKQAFLAQGQGYMPGAPQQGWPFQAQMGMGMGMGGFVNSAGGDSGDMQGQALLQQQRQFGLATAGQGQMMGAAGQLQAQNQRPGQQHLPGSSVPFPVPATSSAAAAGGQFQQLVSATGQQLPLTQPQSYYGGVELAEVGASLLGGLSNYYGNSGSRQGGQVSAGGDYVGGYGLGGGPGGAGAGGQFAGLGAGQGQQGLAMYPGFPSSGGGAGFPFMASNAGMPFAGNSGSYYPGVPGMGQMQMQQMGMTGQAQEQQQQQRQQQPQDLAGQKMKKSGQRKATTSGSTRGGKAGAGSSRPTADYGDDDDGSTQPHAGAPSSPSSTTSGSRKIYICPFPTCGKAYGSRGHLNRHARVHEAEKWFVCPIPGCDKKFARIDNMKVGEPDAIACPTMDHRIADLLR